MNVQQVADDILALRDQTPRFADFRALTSSVVDIMTGTMSEQVPATGESFSQYAFYRIDGSALTRPVNTSLFAPSRQHFERDFDQLLRLMRQLRSHHGQISLSDDDQAFANRRGIESVLYTSAQAFGTALDASIGTQSARKSAGILFEKLIMAVLDEIGIGNAKATLRIPVSIESAAADAVHEEVQLTFRPEIDTIISPYDRIPLDPRTVDPREVLVSVKTTSKDRMAKIFVDRYILRRLVGHDVSTVGIFLHDVQRAKASISATFVAGMFLVYRHLFGDLNGVYYVDPPVRTESGLLSSVIFPFRRFLLSDVWSLI